MFNFRCQSELYAVLGSYHTIAMLSNVDELLGCLKKEQLTITFIPVACSRITQFTREVYWTFNEHGAYVYLGPDIELVSFKIYGLTNVVTK